MPSVPLAHSIWLLAAAADEAAFSETIDALARRFGTPLFHPHLTLVGDIAAAADGLVQALPEMAAGVAPIEVPVASVDVGPAFFRSFYARFSAVAPLAALRQRAHALLGLPLPTDFLPHVSLLYGPVPEGPKGLARAETERRYAGRPVRFDRVAVVSSSSRQPIDRWEILAVAALGG